MNIREVVSNGLYLMLNQGDVGYILKRLVSEVVRIYVFILEAAFISSPAAELGSWGSFSPPPPSWPILMLRNITKYNIYF